MINGALHPLICDCEIKGKGEIPRLVLRHFISRLALAMPDNPSTELALIHLIRDEIHQLRDRITNIEQQTQHRHQELMTALETLTASADALTKSNTDLTAAVNDAITRIGTPGVTDAQILSIASVIDHNTAVITSQTTALRTALDAVPVPPPTV
jgi:hypothetical protein